MPITFRGHAEGGLVLQSSLTGLLAQLIEVGLHGLGHLEGLLEVLRLAVLDVLVQEDNAIG